MKIDELVREMREQHITTKRGAELWGQVMEYIIAQNEALITANTKIIEQSLTIESYIKELNRVESVVKDLRVLVDQYTTATNTKH